MNPKPLSSLNHFTVPVAILSPSGVCALRNAEGAQRQRLRRRGALLWSNGRSTRKASIALAAFPHDPLPSFPPDPGACELQRWGRPAARLSPWSRVKTQEPLGGSAGLARGGGEHGGGDDVAYHRDRDPGPYGSAALVALALAGDHRPRDRVDPRRSLGDDRRRHRGAPHRGRQR